ncbi:MAG: TIGR00730 family Rossman fold protein [Anaerolineales bacterium]|nr:TIGR00730 family Rossman fold protein [Anaerolineales bacterium]
MRRDEGLRSIEKICVYCGSSDTIAELYLEAAQALGRTIAERGLTLIFGGGATGVMGALADSALGGGARVIGIIPKLFDTPVLAHPALTEMRIVENIHTRKAMMIEEADAFIAMPGGLGTLEELFEVLTWAQIGLHRKPVGLLNLNGYFDALLALIQHARAEGFIYDEHRSLLISDDDPDTLLDLLARYQPPEGLERWVNREEKKR